MDTWLREVQGYQHSYRIEPHNPKTTNMTGFEADDEPLNSEHSPALSRSPRLTHDHHRTSAEWNQRDAILRRLTGLPDPTVNEAILSPQAQRPVSLEQRIEQWLGRSIADMPEDPPATKMTSEIQPMNQHRIIKTSGLERHKSGGLEVLEEASEEGIRLSEDFPLNTKANEDWPAPLNIRKSSSKGGARNSHKVTFQPSSDHANFSRSSTPPGSTYLLHNTKGKEPSTRNSRDGLSVPTISDLRRRADAKSSSTPQLSHKVSDKLNSTPLYPPDPFPLNLNKPLPQLPWQRLVSASLDDVRLRSTPEVYQPTTLTRAQSMVTPSHHQTMFQYPTPTPLPTTLEPTALLSQTHLLQTINNFHHEVLVSGIPCRRPSPSLLNAYARAQEDLHDLQRLDSISMLEEQDTMAALKVVARKKGVNLPGVKPLSFPMKRTTSLLMRPGRKSFVEVEVGEERAASSSVYSRDEDGEKVKAVLGEDYADGGDGREGSLRTEGGRMGVRFGKFRDAASFGWRRAFRGKKRYVGWVLRR